MMIIDWLLIGFAALIVGGFIVRGWFRSTRRP